MENFKTMIHILPAEMTLCLRWDTVHLILFSPSLDMNRLCSHWTSRCIVSWCIWSYLCCCKSLSASTLVNQLTHQSPWGRLDAGVCYQNVRPTRTFTAGSQSSSQVFGKHFLNTFWYENWFVADLSRYSTSDNRCKSCPHFFDMWELEGIGHTLQSITEVLHTFCVVISIWQLFLQIMLDSDFVNAIKCCLLFCLNSCWDLKKTVVHKASKIRLEVSPYLQWNKPQ